MPWAYLQVFNHRLIVRCENKEDYFENGKCVHQKKTGENCESPHECISGGCKGTCLSEKVCDDKGVCHFV